MFLILVLRFPRRDWWHLYPKSHVLKCHTARQSSGSRTKTTDPNLSIKYRPVRETWLLPFQLQSFRKSILLSIIHRSAYKQVAELTQQNLCILLTYIQEFTSHGGKIPTKPNCRRNTVTDCSECKKKSIGAKCAVLWWRSEPREAGGLFSTAEQWEVADPSLPRDFSKWHKVLAICAPTDCAPLLPCTLHVQNLTSASWFILNSQEWKPGLNRVVEFFPKELFSCSLSTHHLKDYESVVWNPVLPLRNQKAESPKNSMPVEPWKFRKYSFMLSASLSGMGSKITFLLHLIMLISLSP